jgi:dTDP-4-amino-4,6-dideoxygalactose transaminase
VNSRLDPIQAAVLRVKLKVLDEWNERRKMIAAQYLDALSELDAGNLERGNNGSSLVIMLPFVPDYADPVWHLFVIRHVNRNALQNRLTEAGIGTMIHYPIPPHRQKAYAGLNSMEGDFPIAEAMAEHVISLPIGPQMRADKVASVVEVLRSEEPLSNEEIK